MVTLSLGEHASDLVGFTAPPMAARPYKVEGDSSDPTGKTIRVSAFGFTQVFHNVTSIFADGSYATIVPPKVGADVITIADDVKVAAELHGNKLATGNKLSYQGSATAKLYAGDNGDVLSAGVGDNAELYGGKGNDVLTAYSGNNDTLDGGEGNDQLTAGDGNNDSLFGGEGDDQLEAGKGVGDVLIGGGGNDTITVHVGDGARTIFADAAPAQTVPDPGTMDNLVVLGSPNADTLTASASSTAVAVTTQNPGDQFSGNGFEKLALDGGLGVDTVNVNDLTGTTITEVTVNPSELVVPDQILDITNVDGRGSANLTIDELVVPCSRGSDELVVPNKPGRHAREPQALITGLPYKIYVADTEGADSVILNTGTGPTVVTIDAYKVDMSSIPTSGPDAGKLPDAIKLPGQITVNDGPAANVFNILSTTGTTTINANGGNNVFNVGSIYPATGGALGGIQAGLFLNGSGGADSALFDDSGDTLGKTGTLTGNQLTGLGMTANITYTGMSTLKVDLGSGDDIFTIAGTHARAAPRSTAGLAKTPLL